MRFVSYLRFAVAILALSTAIAAAQNINPATQIRWPICSGTAQVYSIVTNTCIVAGGGGGGGASPNPPNYSIQFAIGSLFGSDPTITISPTLHSVYVGSPGSAPKFTLNALGTILANWTFDVTSPTTAIDSLTGAGTEGYLWTYHLGIGQWQPNPAAGGVTQIIAGSGISISPSGGTGNVTVTATGSGNAFSAITSGTNTAAAMIVGSGASLTPTGTGEIQATHTTQTGLTQCLESLSSGAIAGTGSQCNLFSALAGGTNSSAIMHVAIGASLDYAGGGIVDASEIDGVAVTGTPSSGQVPTATGPTTATWQTPAAGVTTTCNTNGCYQIGSDGSLLEWGTVSATGSGTGGTFTITLPHAMTSTTNQWIELVAVYCNLGSPSSCAAGTGGSNASTPTAGLETASTTAPTIAWWDANTAPSTIEFTWTARGK